MLSRLSGLRLAGPILRFGGSLMASEPGRVGRQRSLEVHLKTGKFGMIWINVD